MDLDDLEAKARLATPGPWRHSPEGMASGFSHVFMGTDFGPGQTVAQWTLPADASYIAAVSPDVVLALIAELRELRAMKAKSDAFAKALGFPVKA